MAVFDEEKEQNLETLKTYVPVVAKVHGGSHPEFHTVKEIFDRIDAKIAGSGTDKPDLDDEFSRLRAVTENYRVPEDVCESYQAVYEMLSKLDRAYQT